MSQFTAFRALAAAVSLGLAASCASTSTAEVVDEPLSPWIQASPLLKEQLEDEAKKLPWAHGLERVEQIRWFASIGEPAYPTLLEMVADPRDHVAAAALAALGATGDRRLVVAIHGVEWPAHRSAGNLSLERARTLVRLGDWSEIPVLIKGLSADRVYTRALSAKALQETTNLHFGFDARGDEAERNRVVQKWEQWWAERSADQVNTMDASFSIGDACPTLPVETCLAGRCGG